MATDFGKLMYSTIEEQLSAQLGERRKAIKKEEWRSLMDIAMKQFAFALVAIVTSVARQSAEASKAAEAAKKAETPAPAPIPAQQ